MIPQIPPDMNPPDPVPKSLIPPGRPGPRPRRNQDQPGDKKKNTESGGPANSRCSEDAQSPGVTPDQGVESNMDLRIDLKKELVNIREIPTVEKPSDGKAAVRQRLLETQNRFYRERALSAEQNAEAAITAATTAGTALDYFVIEVLADCIAQHEDINLYWLIDEIKCRPLRESLMKEAEGQPYIRIVIDQETKFFSYKYSWHPPDEDET